MIRGIGSKKKGERMGGRLARKITLSKLVVVIMQ